MVKRLPILSNSKSPRPDAAANVRGQSPPKRIESLSDSICVKLGTIHPPRSNPDFESLPDSKSPRLSAAANVRGQSPPKRIESLSDSIRVKLGTIQPLRTNPDFESLPDSKSPRPSAAASVRGHRPPAVLKIPARAFTRDRKRVIILEETRRGGNGIAAEGRKGDRAEPPRAA